MEFVSLPRRGGKTRAVVEYLKANPHAVLLVPAAQHARTLLQQYPELRECQIVTPDHVRDGALRGMGKPRIAIDNLDLVLWSLLPQLDVDRIRFATWTDPTGGPNPGNTIG